jgi:O-antigen/teichoic acid export membrane protein
VLAVSPHFIPVHGWVALGLVIAADLLFALWTYAIARAYKADHGESPWRIWPIFWFIFGLIPVVGIGLVTKASPAGGRRRSPSRVR